MFDFAMGCCYTRAVTADPYRQTVPGLDLSIEKATARVPENRHFYVVRGGQILGKHRTLRQATVQFRQILKDLGWKPQLPEVKPLNPAVEAVERYMDRLEAYWDDAAKHRRRGGKSMNRS